MSDTTKHKTEENLSTTFSKLPTSFTKFLWQSGPFSSENGQNLPKFLRKVSVFKNFTDTELYILSKYLNERIFSKSEEIFCQGDIGIGFYLIYQGQVKILIYDEIGEHTEVATDYELSLEKYDLFGELALLQENSIRNATAVAKSDTILLGVFKPDLDDMILEQPIIAAKLLQAISMIVANRLFHLTQEIIQLKSKIEKK